MARRRRLLSDERQCISTGELIEELRRRSLGCMVVCVRAEEDGDAWHYALKGSPLLLGAMTAALQIKAREKVVSSQ